MFVAELYTQFNYETYAELVLTAISNVLVEEDETHVKSACQALKVSMHLTKSLSYPSSEFPRINLVLFKKYSILSN